MTSTQKFCQRGVIRMVISGDFAFTQTQNAPVELWRRRYQKISPGNTNHNNFFRDLCRHGVKTFVNFLSMSILAIHCNRQQETVSMPKSFILSFDANFSSFSLAESPPCDLQITAYK